MTTYRAADLPDGSVVATHDQAWIRSRRADPDPGLAKHCWTPGNWSHTQIDQFIAAGATVLRVGDGRNAPTATVKPGQVWADNDKRSAGRRVRVVEVDATHATVELVAQRGRPARGHEDAQKAEPGRRTRIALARFKPTSTGYRLIHDPEEG